VDKSPPRLVPLRRRGYGRARNGENIMTSVRGVSAERLRSFVERIERLEEEKAALAGDIREVYSEAKGSGFDIKVMRQVMRLRKLDKSARDEQEAVLETYLRALGM
jgi:uncharacterized protein (UPF0335 family)